MSIERRYQGETTILTINPSYKPIAIAGFVTLILIGFIFVFIQSIEQIVKGNFNLIFIGFIGLFFLGAYYNSFNIYWVILGNEIVEINGDFIKHIKCIWILKHSKKYHKSKIGEFKIIDSSNSFGASGNAMFGISNISIQFKYGRKKKMIGKQIDIEAAEQILTELKKKNYAT